MKRSELIVAVVILLLLWQAGAMIVNKPILPTPLSVGRTLIDEIINGNILDHFFASLWRVVISTLLAIIIAAPIGLVLGQSKRLNKYISPMVYLLYPIPKVVFVPILLLFLGIGDYPKITIIFLIL